MLACQLHHFIRCDDQIPFTLKRFGLLDCEIENVKINKSNKSTEISHLMWLARGRNNTFIFKSVAMLFSIAAKNIRLYATLVSFEANLEMCCSY